MRLLTPIRSSHELNVDYTIQQDGTINIELMTTEQLPECCGVLEFDDVNDLGLFIHRLTEIRDSAESANYPTGQLIDGVEY